MRRWRALAAGALSHLAAVEEVVTLDDEGLDDCLVQLGGGQRVLVLKVRPHQSGPEADGQVVGRHQDGLTVLAHPGTEIKQTCLTGEIPDISAANCTEGLQSQSSVFLCF